MKYLWLISQDANNDYDTYDSAVVVAATAEQAKLIHPRGNEHTLGYDEPYGSWVLTSEEVKAKQIGIAADELVEGTVICASFNAG